MKIQVADLLPGVEKTILTSEPEVKAMIQAEGFGPMAKKFFESVLAEMRADRLATWSRSEGYYVNHGAVDDLCAIGALYLETRIYIRGILVKAVPMASVEQTQKALLFMMHDYLDQLKEQTQQRNQN